MYRMSWVVMCVAVWNPDQNVHQSHVECCVTMAGREMQMDVSYASVTCRQCARTRPALWIANMDV